MQIISLGKITTTAGTPVRLTANQIDPTAILQVHSLMVEALAGNTGDIFVGSSGMVRATLVGVYAVIPVPTVNSIPSFTAVVQFAAFAFFLEQIYLDVNVNGEGALVSAILA